MKRIARAVKEKAEAKAEEEGAVAVEYALITGLVSVTIAATVSDLGIRIRDIFQTLADALSA